MISCANIPCMADQFTADHGAGHSSTPLSPTTTVQDDITLAGQRRVNLIWECTQATIAVVITVAVVYASITSTVHQELSNAFFLIVGFYFSRTNHSAIGGVGRKPSPPYEGR